MLYITFGLLREALGKVHGKVIELQADNGIILEKHH